MTTAHLPYGITLAVDEGDHIGRHLAAGRLYEADLLGHLHARIPPGAACVDVGAHVGTHSAFYAAAMQAGRVYAYEPDRATYALLAANAKAYPAVLPFQRACSDVAGRGEVIPGPADNSGMARLEMCEGGGVPVVRLDDEITERVHLVKVDAEGMGAQVLRGALRLLSDYHPVVACECATGEEYADVWALLYPMGYEMTGVYCHTPTYVFE